MLARAKAPQGAAARRGNESAAWAGANASRPWTQRGSIGVGKLKALLKPRVLPQTARAAHGAEAGRGGGEAKRKPGGRIRMAEMGEMRKADEAEEARLRSVPPSVPASSARAALPAWLPPREALAAWLPPFFAVVVGFGVVCVVAAVVRMWRRRCVFQDAVNQKSPKLCGMRRNDSVYVCPSFFPLLLLSCPLRQCAERAVGAAVCPCATNFACSRQLH